MVEEVSVNIDDNKVSAVTQQQILHHATNYWFKLFFDEYNPDKIGFINTIESSVSLDFRSY